MSFKNLLACLFFRGPFPNFRVSCHTWQVSTCWRLEGMSLELCHCMQVPSSGMLFHESWLILTARLCRSPLSVYHILETAPRVWCRAFGELPSPFSQVSHSCFDCCPISENSCLFYPAFWLYKPGGLIGALLLHMALCRNTLIIFSFFFFCGLRCGTKWKKPRNQLACSQCIRC